MNKNTNILHHVPAFFLGILIFFCIPYGYGTNSTESLVSGINNLNEKIDSLNLEKQIFKRNGKSIIEHESAIANLRDSLHRIQNQIQKAVIKAPTTNKTPKVSSILPRNYFDWIIVITGVMAIISGFVLILGIIKNVKNKPSRNYSKRPQTITQQNSDSTPQAPVQPPLPQEKPPSVEKAFPFNKPPELKKPSAFEISEGFIQPLQTKTRPTAQKWEKPSLNSPEIEKLVLQAHNDGMSVSEISRKFQLGSDYVSLLLKVAKKQ
ncbi:MAG: hypothetical protein Q4F84_06245 [Fibrobacter sp.]|nr:hypothetical protein [Fibrobacter sp.]